MCTQALQSQHERVETQQAVSTLRMRYLGPLITSHVPQVAKALKCQLLAKLSDVMPADRASRADEAATGWAGGVRDTAMKLAGVERRILGVIQCICCHRSKSRRWRTRHWASGAR